MWILLLISLTLNLVMMIVLLLSKHQLQSFSTQLKHNLKVESRSSVGVMLYQKERIELAESINQLLLRLREVENLYENLDKNHKQLIASIAHDFRTPLTSMMGYVQLIRQDDKDNAEQYLRIIEGRVTMLSHLVDDFYAMSLLDSHEYPFKISPIRPKRICEEQMVLYYDDLNQVFPNVSIDLHGDSFVFDGDDHALERIYSNIIKNALFHGRNFVKVSDRIDNNEYVLQFMNGIEEQMEMSASRLFERSYKLDRSRSTSSSGLGLAIVKELSEQMNIKISAYVSEHSLTFELRFPKL